MSITRPPTVHLHVVESAEHPAHSVYCDLLACPPVAYTNTSFMRLPQGGGTLVRVVKPLLNLAKLPNVWRVRQRCDLIHSASYLIANRVPWVIDLEHVAGLTGFNQNRLKSWLCRRVAKKYLGSSFCKRILPWSEAAANSVRQYFDDVSIAEKITVVRPAFSATPVRRRASAQRSDSIVRFLFVGKYFLAKGGKEVLAVFDRLRKMYDVKFTIVSPVPEVLKQKYAGVPGLRMLDLMPRDKILRLFAESDVFIMPTHYDTYGMVFLEAMNAGLPVLSTDFFAVPEIVEHGKTGFLAPCPKVTWIGEDGQLVYSGTREQNWTSFNADLEKTTETEVEDALFKYASRLVDDTKLRLRMGKAGQRRVRQEFSVKKRNAVLRKVYEQAV